MQGVGNIMVFNKFTFTGTMYDEATGFNNNACI